MKSWFAKLRISTALDAGTPLPAPLRETISRSDELRRFDENIVGLDRTLRNSAPKREAPPALHSSIMRAIRSASDSAPQPRPFPALRWLGAPALAVLLLAGGWWWTLNHPATPRVPGAADLAPPLRVATTALEQGGQLVRTTPSFALAPLSHELARAERDVADAARFLLASLP